MAHVKQKQGLQPAVGEMHALGEVARFLGPFRDDVCLGRRCV